jgi:hypothetical protein
MIAFERINTEYLLRLLAFISPQLIFISHAMECTIDYPLYSRCGSGRDIFTPFALFDYSSLKYYFKYDRTALFHCSCASACYLAGSSRRFHHMIVTAQELSILKEETRSAGRTYGQN